MLSRTILTTGALAAALLSTSPAAAQSLGASVGLSARVRIAVPQIRVQVGIPAPPVVYVAPRQPMYVQTAPPVYYYNPPPSRSTYYVSPGYSVGVGPEQPKDRGPEWGISGRISGGGFGGNGTRYSQAGGVGGLGVGLRYRPIPYFAVEGNLDGYAGVDGIGRPRGDTAFSVNAIGFVNPRSVVQVYGLAGLGVGHSFVGESCEQYFRGAGATTVCAESGQYNYVGGQIGAGVEFRASRYLAFNADLRGFMRTSGGRTSDGQPEFVAADGRTTNTSGGALVTLGATLYLR